MSKKRKPTLPGVILEEHYINPLEITKTELAETAGIARNTLHKIIKGDARITARIAVRLAKSLNTTPELWLNLQQKYDVWEAENDKTLRAENIRPIVPMVASSKPKY